MPRTTEGSQVGIPLSPDTQAWRHYGDGFAGLINTSRIQGFYASAGDYRDVAVSSTGELLSTLDASGVTIGTVAQGAAGASAWLVTGPLTDTQLRATPVPISGTVQPGNTPNTTPWLTSLHDGTTKAKIAPASTLPVASDTAQIVTVRDALTIGADSSGLAKDATFTAALGTAGDSPAAYTVLDQLTKLRKAAEAELKLVQQLIALQTPALPRKAQATLLHRS